jgi:hypothetical protein
MTSRSRLAVFVFSAFVTLSSPKSGFAQKANDERIPVAIEECEVRGGKHLCSTWHKNGNDYDGTWPDGSVGKMVGPQFSITPGSKDMHVSFGRQDKEGSASGLTAGYFGALHHGKIKDGQFAWSVGDRRIRERFVATFVY